MTTAQEKQRAPEEIPPATDDPVLLHLQETEQQYREIRSLLETRDRDLQEAHEELVRLRKERTQLEGKVDTVTERLQAERKKAERQRKRAEQLASVLKDIHRTLFRGNIYELILEACLKITGATRGLYITTQGKDDRLRIRAAIDVDSYPQSPPSDFIRAICNKVLEEDDTLVWNRGDDLSYLPQPTDGEAFRNAVVAPVVLMQDLNGIIIAVDKLRGEFDKDDAETVLSIGDHASVAVENVRLRRELQRAYVDTVAVLADAMEAKDPYTHGHCEMVSRYSRLIAERLALPPEEESIVCYAALLHDIGKIGVSDGVLNKPGPLLPEERELVRSHVRVGHDLLHAVPPLEDVAQAVLHHHEWFDGSGYPDGLRGADIPIASRILCVVDSYSAMITARSYKEAYSEARAREELSRCAGSQFDPKIVEAFLAILDTPEGELAESEEEAECGVLPSFEHIRRYQEKVD